MGETVLITGGSRGIGSELVRLFADKGYKVGFTYLNSEKEARGLEESLRNRGLTVTAYKADVSVRKEVNAFVRLFEAENGATDILVNNAGIAAQKLFTDILEEDWDRMMAVNVKSLFNCCQAVIPGMIRKKNGKVVNISSIWGITGASCEVHYSTAKAAVIGFTKALAKELGPSGIKVNCVAPGVIETDMLGQLSSEDKKTLSEETPLMRLGTVRDVAESVLFLASSGADFITGQVLSPNGGFCI